MTEALQPWYRHVIRVRYQETDQMGVVYHANYLNWFEIGRTELIRTMGITYQSIEEKGLLLPVIEAEMKFKQPARYDDVVAVYTRIAAHNHIRLEFASEIRRVMPGAVSAVIGSNERTYGEPEGELLVHGGTRHVWLNRSWKPARIDKEAPELYALLQQRKGT